jgi:hypothetical protein
MPTDPQPITLFEVAKRAVEICDPANADPRLGDLLAQFEDADPSRILRLAARAEWKGDPPQRVLDWLADCGVEV